MTKTLRYALRHVWLIFMVVYLGIAALPASYWYNVGQFAVLDSQVGEPIEVVFTGGPIREFIGSYTVISRDVGTLKVACDAASGSFPYLLNSTRPDPLYMSWWAPSDPRCNALPIGVYETTTCWTVSGLFWGLVPPKHICTPPAIHTVSAPK